MARWDRRNLLKGAGALVGGLAIGGLACAHPLRREAIRAPSGRVSIARCRGYDLGAVTSTLERMLDSIGGIGKNVAGKTVAVKLNLTGDIRGAFGGRPARRTYQVHPHVALGLAALLDRAGARRIRFLDCVYGGGELEPLLAESGWDLSPFRALRAAVDFEDTRNLGKGKRYEMVKVPWGGSLFPAYLLNHSYVDCDYYISLAKLKNHNAAGVTLSIKNNFGVTPQALYSQAEPDEGSTPFRAKRSSTSARQNRRRAYRRSLIRAHRGGRRIGCRGTPSMRSVFGRSILPLLMVLNPSRGARGRGLGPSSLWSRACLSRAETRSRRTQSRRP